MRDGFAIRKGQAGDLETLYEICLKTGDGGKDATSLYNHPELIGQIYAAPYVALPGLISFVAEDREGIVGYAAGAVDTRAFENRLELEWWPDLRKRYPDPGLERTNLSPDESRAKTIHHPRPVPDDIVREYPAHIHMNLFERARGKGVGSSLLDSWINAAREQGVCAVHAGVSGANHSGLKFWTARGFKQVRVDLQNGSNGTIWTGRLI
ncbi:GNAT family N-acetyltransferase [Roseibium sp. SCPC15]|uniref:GNAT family N-acetyltransferase n=1 Tax=Roseibium sp. SCP15 TaxID=3141376 RepID=UPI003337049B